MSRERSRWYDILPILIVLVGCAYIAVNANNLVAEGRLITYPHEMVLASLLFLAFIKAARFMEPLHRTSGYPYRQIEDTIRKIMAEHVGPRRTEQALNCGLEKLRRVETYLDEIKATDLHELMRTHETRSILSVGNLMATTALFRKESRNKPYHHRLDFPDTDDANWCDLVVVQKKGGDPSCTFEPICYQ